MSAELNLSNPTISAVFGAVAGAIASFVPTWLLQKRSENNSNNSIKSLVREELKTYSDFIGEMLTQTDPRDSNMIQIQNIELIRKANIILSGKIPMMPFAHFKIFNYDQLQPETKTKTFEKDVLMELELVYQKIRNYGIAFNGLFSAKVKQLEDLKESIDNSLKKLN